jgi:hypothetical protein
MRYRRRIAAFLPLALAVSLSCVAPFPAAADEAVPAAPEPRWWKGNLHTHSLWSDGDDFPEMIADWYRTNGYNFLAISDHNVLSEGIRWMKHADVVKRGGKDALAKYQARFGGGWVQTRGEPGSDSYEIRLKPFSEFRALVEERGRFLLIPGEEISDRAEGLPVHLNATNVQELIRPVGGTTVHEAIENNVRAVEEQARRTGRDILVHLNHPNFGLAITAEDLARVLAERFFEVYNGHPGVKHLGDEHHPAVERLWDIANTIRLGQLQAAPLMGVATDDSHDYHGEAGSRPGRGWILVRASYLTPEHIIGAIKSGEFYASSGVVLEGFSYGADDGAFRLAIRAEPGVEYTTQFIGTPVDYNPASKPAVDATGKELRATRRYSEEVGKVFAVVPGPNPTYRLTGRELYVRATVSSSKPHRDPSFKGQMEQAWVNPVGWERHLKGKP